MQGLVKVFVVVGLYASVLSGAPVQDIGHADSNGPSEWAAHNYERIANEVFGIPASSDPNSEVIWMVTARIRPAYDADGESQLSLAKSRGGRMAADLIKVSAPLLRQIDEIHRQHPDLDTIAVAKLVRVHRRGVDATVSSAALSKIATAFEKLRPVIALENAMVIDPRQYQLWIDAGSQQIYFNLLGPSSGQGNHALIRWIENAHKELDRQLSKAPSPRVH
jgi:hypothetical protein